MAYRYPDLLIEPEALAEQLGDSNLKIFDATVHLVPGDKGFQVVSGLDDYNAGHIPGAAFLDQIQAVSDTSTGLGFSLPAPDALQEGLRGVGIDDGDRVVVYSTGHTMWATRAWWLLNYAGIDKASVLHGGFQAWQEKALPVSATVVNHPRGTVTVRIRPERFVDKHEVLAAIGDNAVCTVNALPNAAYVGRKGVKRSGHITGSVNISCENLLENGRFRRAQELRTVLGEQGLLDAERVICYCGGGISATVDAVACLLAGKEDVAVYDGSLSEWARDESLPMTTGPEPG